MKSLLVAFFFLFASFSLYSQPWMEKFKDQTNPNFYEIKQEFENYWKDHDKKAKGSGYKAFSRWLYRWEKKIMPDGTIPSNEFIVRAAIEKSLSSKNASIQAQNQWSNLGPDECDGGYNGLGRVNCVRVNPNNPNEIWAGTPEGGVWKSTNNGNSWNVITDNIGVLTYIGINDIAFHPSNSNIIYLATGDYDASSTYSLGIKKSTDGGITWSNTGLNWTYSQSKRISQMRIDPSNPNTILVATSDGIYKSTDAGSTFTLKQVGNFADLEFNPSASSIVYTAGNAFYRSTNNGDTWTTVSVTSGANRMAIAVSAQASNVVYVVASQSSNSSLRGVFKSTDAGASFTQLVGTSPNMLGYNNDGSGTGGQGWYDLCIAANPTNANEIVLGGINLWRSTNGGTSWQNASMWWGNWSVTTVHADQHDLYYTSDGSTLYVGNDGGVYRSVSGGASWEWIGNGVKTSQFYEMDIAQSVSGRVIAGAQDNGTKLLKDGIWSDNIGGDGMECLIHPTNANIIYGSYQNGALFKSTNGGTSFRKINDANNDDNYDNLNESGAWVTPFTLDPQNLNTLYVGLVNVWKSTNAGTSFTKISSFSGSTLNHLVVSPTNSQLIIAGTSSALRKTTDGGASWANLTTPSGLNISDLEFDANNGNNIWLTASGYNATNKVYYSTDAGATWTNITGNLPNQSVNDIVFDKNSENRRIYVGADLGVYYSDDNSGVWTSYSNGMPNTEITELKIHWNDQKLYAGTYGRGVWVVDLPTGIATPTLMLPTHLESGVSYQKTDFKWHKSTAAQKYEIQVADVANFSSLMFTKILTDTLTSTDNLASNKLYHWRVRSIRDTDTSAWSSVFTFTTMIAPPTLTFPVNNAKGVLLDNQFKWTAVNGASSYNHRIATDSLFTEIEEENKDVTVAKIDFPTLVHNTRYFWQVQTNSTNGSSPWSNVFSFKTIIGTPSITNPKNNAKNVALTDSITLFKMKDAKAFRLQVSENANFSPLFKDTLLTGSNKLNIFDFKSNTKYYVRATAIDDDSESDDSQVINFTTAIPSLMLLSPADGTRELEVEQLLQWSKLPNISKFDIEISKDSLFTNKVANTVTSSESQFSVKNLLPTTKYFWRVRVNDNGIIGEWTSAFSFVTRLGTPTGFRVEIINPKRNSLRAFWNKLDSAEEYTVELWLNGKLEMIMQTIGLTESTQFSIQPCLPFKAVLVARKTGFQNRASDTLDLIVENLSTTNISPENEKIAETLNPNFSWYALPIRYENTLEISDDMDFENIIFSRTASEDAKDTTYTLDNDDLLFNTQYWWRIKTDAGKCEPKYSEPFSFTTQLEAPNFIVPSQDTTININTITITWTEIDGASRYNLEISDVDETFADKVQNVLETPEFTLSNLEENSVYYLRLKALNDENYSDYSPTLILTTGSFVSVENEIDQTQILVYPNPASNEATLTINPNNALALSANLLDALGNYVFNVFDNQVISNETTWKIDTSKLSSGKYFIELKSGKTSKLIQVTVVK